MTIEKLPSGSYRATIMQNGKRYRRTFDHKPTQKEVLMALADEMGEMKDAKIGKTFEDCSKEYIEMKQNVISPSTVRGYKCIIRSYPNWFACLQIDDISQITINKVVNEISADKSAKTVRNFHGFVSAVLSTFKPDMKIYTTLPQKRKIEPHIPSESDIRAVLDDLRGTDFEIPFMLACMGMRLSEIVALDMADIDFENKQINIRKALVADGISGKGMRLKQTKTTDSERTIPANDELLTLIESKGYICNVHPHSIERAVRRSIKKLNIEPFSLHKLRHYFASKMLTITDSKTVQALGGWKTDSVMKTVYAHSLKEEQEKARRKAVEMFSSNLFAQDLPTNLPTQNEKPIK